jgi:predicted permease
MVNKKIALIAIVLVMIVLAIYATVLLGQQPQQTVSITNASTLGNITAAGTTEATANISSSSAFNVSISGGENYSTLSSGNIISSP